MITMFGRSVRAMRRALGVLLSSAVASLALSAQPMATSPFQPAVPRLSSPQFADSVAAAGDTARAIAILDSVVRADKRNAAAWHQLGRLQWNMARSARDPNYMKDQKKIRLLIAADSALRLAAQLAPDSARFHLDLSRFNIESGVSTTRFASRGQASDGYDAAKRTGDRLRFADAADMMGMGAWRLYEGVANRALSSDQRKVQLGSANNWDRSQARDYIDSFAKKIEPPTGTVDYEKALAFFQESVGADSTSLRYSRHLFMAYAERNRWDDMGRTAGTRARQFPLDYQAQLALGLAQHRRGDETAARLAFDSAFVLMDDVESARLTRFTRILRPNPGKALQGTGGDSLGYSTLPAAQQRGLEAMYWVMSDPLALTTENEHRLEFLARVVYADFRWTVDELNLRGADSDRGDIHVRYGPPDYEVNIPGSTTNPDGGNVLTWSYRNGLTFFFDSPPGFSNARIAFADRDYVERIKNSVPVSWSNVLATRALDTIPLRIARFRSGADSSDAVIVALVPIDSLVATSGLDRAPVDLEVRIFDQFVKVRGLEVEQSTFATNSANDPLDRVWTRRLGPGINVVRVEALQADSKRGARAMARLTPAVNVGFGMSDVLLGSKPELRSGVTTPSQWRDVAMTPNVGSIAQGTSLGLLWEMYDLVPRDGMTKYRVAITVEREDRKGAIGFAVRVLDNVGRAVGRTQQQSRDRFTISFDRQGSALPVLVEYLSLDMTQAPTGGYRLHVEVTDLSNQKKTARNTEFRIR
ncbi:GWxTD domain-containing protein [Gemmatimonas sp.]|uniref:GWxTD domain-containing protein n=1 Tax=Gemmatimonas sp. TaxID=1962908 RepID=UPI0035639960